MDRIDQLHIETAEMNAKRHEKLAAEYRSMGDAWIVFAENCEAKAKQLRANPFPWKQGA